MGTGSLFRWWEVFISIASQSTQKKRVEFVCLLSETEDRYLFGSVLEKYRWENANNFGLKEIFEMQVVFGNMCIKNTLEINSDVNVVW